MNNKRKKNIKRVLLGALFFPFTVLLFAPLDNYLLSPESYNFSFWDILSSFIPIFLIVFAILFSVLYFLSARARGFVFATLFFITITLYIHGNYLDNNFGILDGNKIEWEFFTGSAISSIIAVIICLAAVSATIFIFRKKAEKILLVIALILISMQSVTCVIQTVEKAKSISFFAKKQPLITTNEQFELSKTQNVVVFVVDTLDTRFITKLLEDDEFTENFKDFTFFNDCVGINSYTYFSVPYILTGEKFEAGEKKAEYGKKAYLNSEFLSELNNRNYRLGIYSEQSNLHLVSDAVPNYDIANFETEIFKRSESSAFLSEYSKLIAFRYLPFHFKRFFVAYTGDINAQMSSQTENPIYKIDDAVFYDTLCSENLSFDIEKPVFKLYHLFGAHPPYTLSAEAKRVEESTRSAQIDGSLHIIKTFMDELRQNGMYDNTAIVITGDHGSFSTRVSTAILIKRMDERNESIVVSDTPVSFEEHLENTMMSLIGESNVGTTMYDAVDSETERSVWVPILRDTSRKGYITFYELSVQGKVTNNNQTFFTGNYAPELSEAEYHLGDRLGWDFVRREYNGFSVNEASDCAEFYGEMVAIPLYISQLPTKNIRFFIELEEVQQFPGTAELYLNGQRIGRSAPDIETREMSFIVPHDMLSSNMLVFQLYFDGVAEMSSFESDGIRPFSFKSIYLEETDDLPKVDSNQYEMSLGYTTSSQGIQEDGSLNLSPNESASTWYINMPRGKYEITVTGSGIDTLGIGPAFSVDSETRYPPTEIVNRGKTGLRQTFILDEDEKYVTVMLWSTDKPVEIDRIVIRKIENGSIQS